MQGNMLLLLNTQTPLLTCSLDILQTYRDVTPDAFMYFNYMPNTTLWAINQRFPLGENCTELGKPGTDLVSTNCMQK